MRREEHLLVHLVLPPHITKCVLKNLVGVLKAGEFSTRYFICRVLVLLSYVHKVKECNMPPG